MYFLPKEKYFEKLQDYDEQYFDIFRITYTLNENYILMTLDTVYQQGQEAFRFPSGSARP